METAIHIDGKTRLCGLIGNPVEHTISPDIHHALAGSCKINMAYLPFLVEKERLREAVAGAYALNALGVNVTVPFKKDVIPFLKDIDPMAAAMESVNTLVRTSGGYKGYNTDMSGLYRAMQEDGVFVEGADVAVLGAGGVGRAVAYLCAMKKARSVMILNRSRERAQQVAEEVQEKTGHRHVRAFGLDAAGKLPCESCLAIQATSVGLYPDCDAAAVEEPEFYRKVHTGYDLIYRPAETKFMKLVKAAGGISFNGLKMLVYQAVEAFELWNGVAVSEEQAHRIYQMLSQKTER